MSSHITTSLEQICSLGCTIVSLSSKVMKSHILSNDAINVTSFVVYLILKLSFDDCTVFSLWFNIDNWSNDWRYCEWKTGRLYW